MSWEEMRCRACDKKLAMIWVEDGVEANYVPTRAQTYAKVERLCRCKHLTTIYLQED